MGIKKLRLMNKAFLMKLGWAMLGHLEANWVKAVKSKYGSASQDGQGLRRSRTGLGSLTPLGKYGSPWSKEPNSCWSLEMVVVPPPVADVGDDESCGSKTAGGK
ncbi:OLC1v1026186C1 [Oldenlandia corymbosa var. corymbosa]|uniref:OLC1v1026186C1 n=1 Tax=Oldenlandia corymbosa var. corymbosa TaxID=529605 RepID=A0AAV1C7A2_OLDCO|nr:OLC1v1026186C1 [Oldenlandia corymbosa var. corymbosa]